MKLNSELYRLRYMTGGLRSSKPPHFRTSVELLFKQVLRRIGGSDQGPRFGAFP